LQCVISQCKNHIVFRNIHPKLWCNIHLWVHVSLSAFKHKSSNTVLFRKIRVQQSIICLIHNYSHLFFKILENLKCRQSTLRIPSLSTWKKPSGLWGIGPRNWKLSVFFFNKHEDFIEHREKCFGGWSRKKWGQIHCPENLSNYEAHN
jgi:hypothetical protein